MKPLLILLSLLAAAAAQQTATLYNDGTRIQVAKGSDQRSAAYTMPGPYVIRWLLTDDPPSKRDHPWWKPTEGDEWSDRWLSITVHDAQTGERIKWEMLSGQENYLAIPKGGTHYVVATAGIHTGWTLWAKAGVVRVTERGPELVPAPVPVARPAVPASPVEPRPSPAPAPTPRPSSVPGLPPGVEPAKGGGLPPGVTRP
jgi:hypothetical protein